MKKRSLVLAVCFTVAFMMAIGSAVAQEGFMAKVQRPSYEWFMQKGIFIPLSACTLAKAGYAMVKKEYDDNACTKMDNAKVKMDQAKEIKEMITFIAQKYDLDTGQDSEQACIAYLTKAEQGLKQGYVVSYLDAMIAILKETGLEEFISINEEAVDDWLKDPCEKFLWFFQEKAHDEYMELGGEYNDLISLCYEDGNSAEQKALEKELGEKQKNLNSACKANRGQD